ncbi:MAG: FecR family protein [Saprospiraceae bacterium]|nr:FecR family protein [Saprospiraceae bacterium]
MHIIRFIKGIFQNRSQQEEQSALRDWYNDSQATMKALSAMHDPEILSDQLKGYDAYDPDKAWQKVQSATADVGHVKSLKNRYYVGAAAALLIILAVSIMFRNTVSESPFNAQSYTAQHRTEKYIFADGSEIILDKGSEANEVAYRVIELKGRAYFTVTKDPDHPFKVNTAFGRIEVLGTQFSLSTDALHTEIMVSEGKVKFTDLKGKVFILERDHFLTSDADNTLKTTLNNAYYLSWKDQSLRLRNASLAEAADGLSQYFRTTVALSPQLQNVQCIINTTFTTEQLEEALQELRLIIGLEYEIRNNEVVITKVKC